MRCVIRDVLQYVFVLDYDIRCSKKRKSHTLKLKLEAGEPVVLIEAGGLTALF